jgi:hypothetical protein
MCRCKNIGHLPICNAVASPLLIERCILLVCPTATVQWNQERNHSVGIVDSLTVQCGLFTVHQLHPLLCKMRTNRFPYKPHIFHCQVRPFQKCIHQFWCSELHFLISMQLLFVTGTFLSLLGWTTNVQFQCHLFLLCTQMVNLIM